jgi:NitT/TauT family transport system substrate-binding protein
MDRGLTKAIVWGVLLMVGAGLAGCEPESKSASGSETTNLPIKIAKAYWPGTFWVEIAHHKEWFKEAGLSVELIDTATDYVGSLTDMVEGKMDANNFSLFDLMTFNAAGSDLVMVINSDNSNGAEAILANLDIDTLRDLRGKNIGVGKGTYLEYIVIEALATQGVDISRVKLIDILSENAANELDEGNLDALITYEPVVSVVLAAGNSHKLFDTSEIPGISPNGLTFHRSFIEQRPADVQAFVNVWHKSTQFLQQNPAEAFGIIAQIYGDTPGQVQSFVQMDKILDLRENITSHSFGSGFDSLHGTARKINNFLIENGVTDTQMDSTEFIDSRFLRSLSESSQ